LQTSPANLNKEIENAKLNFNNQVQTTQAFTDVAADGNYNTDDAAILGSLINNNAASIEEVATQYSVEPLQVIGALVENKTMTAADIALRYEDTSESQLIFNLINEQILTPEQVAGVYDQYTAADIRAAYQALEGNMSFSGGGMLEGDGYYLGGATDGMADQVPATIGGAEPARLSDGEFVVPADVVSHLGNGNSQAGSQQLYSMMDRVRKERTGTTKQGVEINPMQQLPA